MKDCSNIASFNNPEIKVLKVNIPFTFPVVSLSFTILVTLPIEDKNIIPVYLRAVLVFPDYESVAPSTSIVNGIHMSSMFYIKNNLGNNILEVFPCCNSHSGNPKYEQEFYGQIRKPLSENDGLVRVNAILSTLNDFAFAIAIHGFIKIDLYYIPIRY